MDGELQLKHNFIIPLQYTPNKQLMPTKCRVLGRWEQQHSCSFKIW